MRLLLRMFTGFVALGTTPLRSLPHTCTLRAPTNSDRSLAPGPTHAPPCRLAHTMPSCDPLVSSPVPLTLTGGPLRVPCWAT